MKKIYLKILILCILCSGCCNKTQQENLYSIDITEQKCISKVDSTDLINKCSLIAIDAWYEEINKYLILLKSLTTSENYLNIQKSQQEWEKYRDAEFLAINSIIEKQGTMYQNTIIGFKKEIIKNRAIELKRLYDILKF